MCNAARFCAGGLFLRQRLLLFISCESWAREAAAARTTWALPTLWLALVLNRAITFAGALSLGHQPSMSVLITDCQVFLGND